MSVALELVPEMCEPLPERPVLRAVPDWDPVGPDVRALSRPGAVTVLHPPRERETAAPLRLTRRGVVVLGLALAMLAGGLLWLAARSAPSDAAGSTRAVPAGTVVTVAPGDTLWSVASRIAPDRDPRAEVAAIARRNHLAGADLTPGQTLRVP